MTLREAFCQVAKTLSSTYIEDVFIETEILLKHTLQLSSVQLYTEPERKMTPEEITALHQVIERRLNFEPVAYILGHREFYGLEFYVDQRTFIPRPESEILVEKTLEFANNILPKAPSPLVVVDVGTGCGALAIAIALNLPKAKVFAIDISPVALEVALINCQRHKVEKQITLLQGNMLQPLPEKANIIVANLPYIKSSELGKLSQEIISFEPIIALDGGKDGLDKIAQLLQETQDKLHSPSCILLEIGKGQGKKIVPLVKNYFLKAEIELIPDLMGTERVIKIIPEEH